MAYLKNGFSLVELSVVILIIGLLTAGVTSGAKLVKQAELRSILREYEEINVAINTFKSTYDAVPGDMQDASTFFSGCATTGGTAGVLNCNGNGDGFVTYNMGNGYDGDQIGDEPSKVFRHLFLADLYEKGGTIQLPHNYVSANSYAHAGYFGESGTIDNSYYVVVSVDAGSTGGSTYAANTIYNTTTNGVLASNFDVNDTAIYLFDQMSGEGGLGAINAFDAWQLDKKIDDGKSDGTNATGANSGSFRTISDPSGATCVSGTNYSIALTSTVCLPGFQVK